MGKDGEKETGALDTLRDEIDATDDQLLELLNHRAALAERVAAAKQGGNRAFYVPARERAIIDRLQDAATGKFPKNAIRPVFQEVISACLSLEQGVRVAYLGPEATFTHQAVKRHFGTSATTVPCGSIAGAFDEVERGLADFAVVPIENSSEGMVNHTLDSFIASSLTICAEILVDVDHCLIARTGVGESQIERIYSHPQALRQCRSWLNANTPRARLVECASTAEAAQRAKADAAGAAIAAELAARTYRLEVLRHKLQDALDNITRFLVVGHTTQDAPGDGAHKTTLLLALPDQAGSLYRILEPLSAAAINMTRIESRPSRRQPWDYVFFIDVDGHRHDPTIAQVLTQMADICALFKVLGSYRKADAI
jgi:chorismate mutase/prephenate dehydratase